jgi:CelD/BcsL family acetyltransferase involved in cellulose biosynthesis
MSHMSQMSLTPHDSLLDLGARFTALADTLSPPAAADDSATGSGSVAAAEWPPRIALHDDLAAVAESWRALAAQSDCTAFQVYDWVAAWQTHVGTRTGTVPAIVTGEADDCRPLFLFAFAIEPSRGLRRLTWLASDMCDYNAPMLARDFAATLDAERFRALWRSILARLAGDPRFQFDYVDLQRMPEKIGAVRDPFLALKPDLHPSGAHACALTGDWQTFYAAKRSASTRKTVRKQLKQIEKHGDPVTFDDVADTAARRHTLDVLMTQKAQSLARMGAENFFDRPGYRDFYRAVIADPAMRDLVHITRLSAGPAIIATSVGLKFGSTFYLILASYDGGPISAHGPGRAHLHELLRHALEHGYHRFDFTVGDEPYKLDWGDETIRLFDYLAGRTLTGWALVLTTRAYRRVKRLIKQTPALWRLFVVLRTHIGGHDTAAGHRDDNC